jgi:hypothetical protein
MHPYENLGPEFFWATAVAKRNMFDIEGLWSPKFGITKRHKIVTFGSCFAQHIGRAFDSRGFTWLNSEPAPHGLSKVNAKKYNYGIFSARTGNIYTVSLLKQWVSWASSEMSVPDEVWEKEGRYYDPFRPNIEPNGFASKSEMLRSRELTINAFKTGLTMANIFVFTLGLTESWFNKEHGYEYPMCPGVVAGDFDENKHEFVNQTYPFILKKFVEAIRKIRELNPNIRFLLTVSPVPLTATMSGKHVLVATMESKSILRAVAGQVARQFALVDYFPSYEIVNATPFRGTFFEPNQRNVNHTGVDHVMNSFFNCLNAKFPIDVKSEKRQGMNNGMKNPVERQMMKKQPSESASKSDDDVVCEEELLGAFAK